MRGGQRSDGDAVSEKHTAAAGSLATRLERGGAPARCHPAAGGGAVLVSLVHKSQLSHRA